MVFMFGFDWSLPLFIYLFIFMGVVIIYRTAIVIACSLGMTQIVALLLSKGADRSVMNRKSINCK